jgi:hypothetical protein
MPVDCAPARRLGRHQGPGQHMPGRAVPTGIQGDWDLGHLAILEKKTDL